MPNLLTILYLQHLQHITTINIQIIATIIYNIAHLIRIHTLFISLTTFSVKKILIKHIYRILSLDRTHSWRHTGLSDISNSIVGGEIITHCQLVRTIFLPMWGLQIMLFGLRDSLVRRRSTECQLGEDNHIYRCTSPK